MHFAPPVALLSAHRHDALDNLAKPIADADPASRFSLPDWERMTMAELAPGRQEDARKAAAEADGAPQDGATATKPIPRWRRAPTTSARSRRTARRRTCGGARSTGAGCRCRN